MKPDTEQKYFMNTVTGSVGVADGWDDEDLKENLWVVEVVWDNAAHAWVEAE